MSILYINEILDKIHEKIDEFSYWCDAQ